MIFVEQKEKKSLPGLHQIVYALEWQSKMTSGKNFRKLGWSCASETCDLCGEVKSEGSVRGMSFQMKYKMKEQTACIH